MSGETADFSLISSSQVDINKFLLAANQTLGRSVTRGLDANNIPAKGFGAFLATVAEFKATNSDPLGSIRYNRHNIARHIHFSFIVASNPTTLGLMSNDLSVTQNGTYALVSGALNQWMNCIISLLSTESSVQTRVLLNKFLLWFDGQGLGEFWGLWQRIGLPDRTFILEPK